MSMENIENATQLNTEQSTDQYDAFADGFGADETPDTEQVADQQAEQVEEQAQTEETDTTETEDGADTADAESGDNGPETMEPGEDANPAERKEQTAPISWQIKHMGETKTFGAGDVTPELLQKGLDYDRIRGKYDEAKPVMEMFSEFAKAAGMSVADYAKFIRTEAKKAAGMSEAEAKRTVELEEREAAVAAQEAQRQETADNKAEREARIQADLSDFAKAFPDVYKRAKTDKFVIPASVWEDVGRGLSLTAAYSRHAVKQAQADAQAAKTRADVAVQGQKNASRSTGSMRSAGNDKKLTPAFLEGFGT